ncbi:hypothetical protein BDN70DRAFT_920448 [Pholiota conissans]|uniref:Uncharacterized protein n=1 Tax=Pholiota conissans TaxID=109636 RepID=A0A9P6CUJ1_9AGAR|nr:hypothetical protein BDN70DRAFT_920448 [Pholiota conissans]
MGYAIWLVPSSTEFMALSELMKFRPQPHILNPYSRSYPSFDPHITLATFDYLPSSFNLEAIPLKGLQRPVTTFGSMRCGSSYLGALSVRMSDSRQFRRVHEAVVTYLSALGMHWRSHDFPHMSLFYVDEPVERKRLDAQLANSGRVQRYDAGRGLVLDPYPNSARSIPVTTFTGEEIWLVDCTSHSVNHWRVMRRRFLVSPILPPAPKSILKNPSSARPSSLHRTRSNRVNRGAKSSRRRRQASSFNRFLSCISRWWRGI